MTHSEPQLPASSGVPTDVAAATPGPATRFEVDATNEDHAARLRLAAAIGALLASLWLFAVSDVSLLRVLGGAGCVFAVLWMRGYWQRDPAQIARSYLELGEQQLSIADGAALRSVALADVRSVELDHDRLLVVLCLADGETLDIEPRYRGIGLRELGERILAATQKAQAAPSQPSPGPRPEPA